MLLAGDCLGIEHSKGNIDFIHTNSFFALFKLTHKAKAADVDAALEEIKASGVIGEDPIKLRVI